MARIICFLGLLCFVLCMVENKVIEEEYGGLQFQQDAFSSLNNLHPSQDSVKKQNLKDLFYKLSISKSGIIPQEPEDSEIQEKNRRGSGSDPSSPKPCRILYWKSWASC